MPHQTLTKLYTLFGFIAWGDIAEITIYRSRRGKMVWFPKTYPDKPPSPDQLTQRQKFTDAAQDWQSLTEDQRNKWDLVTRKASLCMTGYNLYVHWHIFQDDDSIHTLEHQTGITLLSP